MEIQNAKLKKPLAERDPEIDLMREINRKKWRAYLKRVAAIHGLQRGKQEISKDDALYRLGWLVDRLHDPLTWNIDVQRRMDEMRLGM